MTATVRTTTIDVDLAGNPISNVLSARVSLGYDLSFAEATVVCATVPSGSYYDTLSISLNSQTRFTGVLAQVDYTLFPRSVALIGRGRLWQAAQFKLDDDEIDPDEGLPLIGLLGATSGTDEEIVQAVLDRAGIDTNGGSIGGTGTELGTIAPEEFAWKFSESALDYIQRIDTISLGYRTFETAGGQIFRSQISSHPSGGADMTFTEGVDISGGNSSRTVQDAYNAVRVGGYAVGDFADPRVFYVAHDSPYPRRVFTFESAMIERKEDASAGEGISCESVANYWIDELNREIVKLTMTTPRDDLIGPGQLHLVQGPGGSADRLGTGEKLWVQRVDVSVDQNGAFSQSVQYIGGNID